MLHRTLMLQVHQLRRMVATAVLDKLLGNASNLKPESIRDIFEGVNRDR
jgi:hypothetical protein